MKKLVLLYILTVAAIVGCDFSSTTMSFFGSSDSLKIERYDRIQYRYLTTGDFSALQQMNTDFPIETRLLIEDILKLGTVNDRDIYKTLFTYYQDSTLQTIMRDVQTKFSNIDNIHNDLAAALQRMQKEFPGMEMPRFYTQVGALNESIIVGDKTICIALDKYLGKDYPIYARYYDEQQRETMTPEYIVPDCILFCLISMHRINNFEMLSQADRDHHMKCLMWAVNRIVDRKAFDFPNTQQIEEYMKKHPEMTISDLLLKEDFSDME